MVLSNRERQALYRGRAMSARARLERLMALLRDAVGLTQRAAEIERARGTAPDDGSPAGRILADQEEWVGQARRELDRPAAEQK